MKTFNEFITEARVSTKRRALRAVTRQVKRAARAVSSSKPAKKAKRFVTATAAGVALRLLTGL